MRCYTGTYHLYYYTHPLCVCIADCPIIQVYTHWLILPHILLLCLKPFTGDTVIIERVSPEIIILRPPEKLVIEVRTSGEYEVHFWHKNENLFSLTGFPVVLPDEFPNFAEIFVRDNTTNDDLGIYRVQPSLGANAQTHTIMPGTSGVDFAVIAQG